MTDAEKKLVALIRSMVGEEQFKNLPAEIRPHLDGLLQIIAVGSVALAREVQDAETDCCIEMIAALKSESMKTSLGKSPDYQRALDDVAQFLKEWKEDPDTRLTVEAVTEKAFKVKG